MESSHAHKLGTAKSMSIRLQSVDFLRGIAAFSVVLFHAFGYGHSTSNLFWFHGLQVLVGQGYLGVPLFFVISGFCIHQKWARQYSSDGHADVNFLGFWRRRLYRLYPPYFLALCFSVSLVVLAYASHANVPLLTLYPEPKPRWIALDFFMHAGMLHGFHPVFDELAGNPPFWTLAREECLYLMYFILLAIRRPRGTLETLLWVTIAGLAFPLVMLPHVISNPGWLRIVNTSAIALWIEWALGMAAVEAHYGILKLPAWCSFGWLVPIWASMAKLSEFYFSQISPLLWGITFFTLLNYCLQLERTQKWPAWRIVRWFTGVGVFSYSLYLIHVPARTVVKYVFHIPTVVPNPWLYISFASAMAAAGCLAGLVFFWIVERPFLVGKNVENVARGISSTPCQRSVHLG
jgi:peptidoglycan/LPS O-acetylase OafA/YrhL